MAEKSVHACSSSSSQWRILKVNWKQQVEAAAAKRLDLIETREFELRLIMIIMIMIMVVIMVMLIMTVMIMAVMMKVEMMLMTDLKREFEQHSSQMISLLFKYTLS